MPSLTSQPNNVVYSANSNIDESIRKQEPKHAKRKFVQGEQDQVGAIEAVGNLLSLPGSSVLDIASGRNPFDQWADPFGKNAEQNRTTGRKLLRDYGLVGTDDTWTNWALGTAIDVATDPLTFVGGLGAASKAGKLATKAGLAKDAINVASDSAGKAVGKLGSLVRTTPRQLIEAADDVDIARNAWRDAGGTDELLDETIGSLASVRLPGTKGKKFINRKVADSIDAGAERLSQSRLGRSLRAAFSPKVANAVSKTGQDIAEVRTQAVEEAITDLGHEFAKDELFRENASHPKVSAILSRVEQEALDVGLLAVKPDDKLSPLERAERLTRATSMSHAATELLGTSARMGGDGVALDRAVKLLGLDEVAAGRNLKAYLGEDSKLDSYSIDPELLFDAMRFVKPFTQPESAGVVRKAIEKFHSLFKSHVTVPFPAFHVRNLFSGQLQNAFFGAMDRTSIADAYRLRDGQTIKGLANAVPEFKRLGMNDATATRELAEEAFARRVIGPDQGLMADIAEPAFGDVSARLPGASRDINPLRGKFQKAPEGSTYVDAVNPFKTSTFLPTRLGGDVAQFTEDLNRLSGYIALRRKGHTADQAAELVKKIQVDYSSATAFERKYAKNLIPFWMYGSRMLPLAIEELVQHPGGPIAQIIKEASMSKTGDEPHWTKSMFTIPLGKDAAGNPRFVSGLGVPWEESASMIGDAVQGNGDASLRNIASRLSPLLKFPIEEATGRSLFYETSSGKPAPVYGNAFDAAMASSPATRYLSMARKANSVAEEPLRTIVNALTGIRVD